MGLSKSKNRTHAHTQTHSTQKSVIYHHPTYQKMQVLSQVLNHHCQTYKIYDFHPRRPFAFAASSSPHLKFPNRVAAAPQARCHASPAPSSPGHGRKDGSFSWVETFRTYWDLARIDALGIYNICIWMSCSWRSETEAANSPAAKKPIGRGRSCEDSPIDLWVCFWGTKRYEMG